MPHANDDLPNKRILMARISTWIETISVPEFHEYKRRHIRYALADDFEREHGSVETYGDFLFPEPIKQQHELIMSFLFLSQATEILQQTEYYFRRYPFSNLPVSREDHARNMCEFYFSQFYVVENRIKEVMKHLKAFGMANTNDVGKIVRQFQKEFDQELRMRNRAIHHEPFDDPDLDRLLITKVMSTSPDLSDKGWDREHLHHYRKFASSWSKRARRRTADVKVFLARISHRDECIGVLKEG
jgi:hypothetical protein